MTWRFLSYRVVSLSYRLPGDLLLAEQKVDQCARRENVDIPCKFRKGWFRESTRYP